MKIIFVGRLIYAKGCQDLILATRDIDAQLVIVGDGPYRRTLELMNGHAEFKGELPIDGVMKELSESDIFVNPSYSEGLPTSVVEAASVGLPIISTDVGGTNEIIQDGVTGILIPPHNPAAIRTYLLSFIRDYKSAKAMGERAKQFLIENKERFSWDYITKQYEEVFKEVVKKK
jgi:glycosyltransferase involved in cell wall biosynthesis